MNEFGVGETACPNDSALRRELVEGRAAVLMVADGAAVRVSVDGLQYAARVAATILPMAQELGVPLRIERRPNGAESLVVGPRR